MDPRKWIDEVAGTVSPCFSAPIPLPPCFACWIQPLSGAFLSDSGCLYHLEDDFTVGDVDGCTAQFFVENSGREAGTDSSTSAGVPSDNTDIKAKRARKS